MTVHASRDPAANARLPYLINDADEHSTPAACGVRALHRSGQEGHGHPDGQGRRRQASDALQRPARPLHAKNFQVVGSNEQLEDVRRQGPRRLRGAGRPGDPGSLLTRLNPLKDLDADGRRDFAKKYRELQAQLDNPADRLAVMDSQGIGTAVNFATLPGTEAQFEGDLPGLYANLDALNRYLGERVGLQLREPALHPAVRLVRRPRGRAAPARRDHEDRGAEGHPDLDRPVDAHVAVPPRERPLLGHLQRGRASSSPRTSLR